MLHILNPTNHSPGESSVKTSHFSTHTPVACGLKVDTIPGLWASVCLQVCSEQSVLLPVQAAEQAAARQDAASLATALEREAALSGALAALRSEFEVRFNLNVWGTSARYGLMHACI